MDKRSVRVGDRDAADLHVIVLGIVAMPMPCEGRVRIARPAVDLHLPLTKASWKPTVRSVRGTRPTSSAEPSPPASRASEPASTGPGRPATRRRERDHRHRERAPCHRRAGVGLLPAAPPLFGRSLDLGAPARLGRQLKVSRKLSCCRGPQVRLMLFDQIF